MRVFGTPSADSTGNRFMEEVVGNKLDTVSGNSIVSLVKQLLANILVPTANAITNVRERDVIGNKADAASNTASQASIVGLLRYALALFLVPTADVTTNTDFRHVIGNKSDAANVTASQASIVGLLRSIISYLTVPTADVATDTFVNFVLGRKSDTVAGTSAMALLKQIIFGATHRVERSAADTPQTLQTPYFTVTGRVLVTQIIGEVTEELGAGANNLRLIANPTVGADVDLCADKDTDGDVVGTLYTITGTLADAMVATTSGAVKAQAAGILVAAGTIDLKADASKTGKTKWTVHYTPVDAGSSVVVA